MYKIVIGFAFAIFFILFFPKTVYAQALTIDEQMLYSMASMETIGHVDDAIFGPAAWRKNASDLYSSLGEDSSARPYVIYFNRGSCINNI